MYINKKKKRKGNCQTKTIRKKKKFKETDGRSTYCLIILGHQLKVNVSHLYSTCYLSMGAVHSLDTHYCQLYYKIGGTCYGDCNCSKYTKSVTPIVIKKLKLGRNIRVRQSKADKDETCLCRHSEKIIIHICFCVLQRECIFS